jgi:Flp pilus assembly protein TadG
MPRTTTHNHKLKRPAAFADESGAALVEFVLVLPVLLVLLFGTLDFGKAYNYWIDGTQLAHEGSRFAAVNKNPGAPAVSLQEWIRGQADTPELKNGGTASVPSALSVCITFPNTTSQIGDPVRVRVTTTYSFLSFLTSRLNITNKTILADSTMRLEQPPTNFSAGCT